MGDLHFTAAEKAFRRIRAVAIAKSREVFEAHLAPEDAELATADWTRDFDAVEAPRLRAELDAFMRGATARDQGGGVCVCRRNP